MHDPSQDAGTRAVYLVVVRGDGLVTRRLADGFVRAAARDGATLRLRFADFTFPQARIDFTDDAVARDWEARFARAGA